MDDLSRLLVQQPQPGARFGQGTLREWNPATFEHVIEWRGLRIRDATILAGVDALTWQPGDQVLLLGADQSGRRGWTDWMVLGRAITPGPGAGEQAIDWMTTALASRLARQLLGEATHTAYVAAYEGQSHTLTWADLATPGPAVSNVEIGESGTALVILSARIDITYGWGTGYSGANLMTAMMGLEITGATSRPPDPWASLEKSGQLFASTGQVTGGATVSSSKVLIIQGLNPGVHTFTAKYRTIAVPTDTGAMAEYSDRLLAVLPL